MEWSGRVKAPNDVKAAHRHSGSRCTWPASRKQRGRTAVTSLLASETATGAPRAADNDDCAEARSEAARQRSERPPGQLGFDRINRTICVPGVRLKAGQSAGLYRCDRIGRHWGLHRKSSQQSGNQHWGRGQHYRAAEARNSVHGVSLSGHFRLAKNRFRSLDFLRARSTGGGI